MCGFGIVLTAVTPTSNTTQPVASFQFIIDQGAKKELAFSKKATQLQGTSIRQYYNNSNTFTPQNTPLLEVSNDTEITRVISNKKDKQNTNSIQKTSLEVEYDQIISTLSSWLHRRGPDVTNIIHFNNNIHKLPPLTQHVPTNFLQPFKMSIISSVLHLRGIEDIPNPQPIVFMPKLYQDTSELKIHNDQNSDNPHENDELHNISQLKQIIYNTNPQDNVKYIHSFTKTIVNIHDNNTDSPLVLSLFDTHDQHFTNLFPIKPLKCTENIGQNGGKIALEEGKIENFLPFNTIPVTEQFYSINQPTLSVYKQENNKKFNNNEEMITFSWNGEVFAGDIPVKLGESDTVIISNRIKDNIHTFNRSLYSTKETQALFFTDINEYSREIAAIVHDILNTVQGPFSMLLTYTTSKIIPIMCSMTNEIRYEEITFILFCRDKIGRRSLVLRMFKADDHKCSETMSNIPNNNLNVVGQNADDKFNGLILASQPILLQSDIDLYNINPKTTTFIQHSPDWYEVPCGGLFYLTIDHNNNNNNNNNNNSNTEAIPHTLSFLPWNYHIISSHHLSHQNTSTPLSNSKIPHKTPDTMLFPRLHPSLTPLPSPQSLLPEELLCFFYKITQMPQNKSHSDMIPSQIFFLRLAEAVRRQVQSLPKHTHTNYESIKKNGLTLPHSNRPARIAVLFSGGIDCTAVAALAHYFLNPDNPQFHVENGEKFDPNDKESHENVLLEPIDLINVAFIGNLDTNDPKIDSSAPDRVASIDSYMQLCSLAPNREWRLIKVNVSAQDIIDHAYTISSLIAPHDTTMDFNIGTILYFGSRGHGILHDIDENHEKREQFIKKNNSDQNGGINGSTTRYTIHNGNNDEITVKKVAKLTQKERHEMLKQQQTADVPNSEKMSNDDENGPNYMNSNTIDALFTLDLFKFIPWDQPKLLKSPQNYIAKPIFIAMKKLLGEQRRLETKLEKLIKEFDQNYLKNKGNIDKLLETSEKFENIPIFMEIIDSHGNDHSQQNSQLLLELKMIEEEYSNFKQKNSEKLYISNVICNNLALMLAEHQQMYNPSLQNISENTQNQASNTEKSHNSLKMAKSKETVFYQTHAKVLLLGSGADEQLAGYGRHRTTYNNTLRHLMPYSLCKHDVYDIKEREAELYGQKRGKTGDKDNNNNNQNNTDEGDDDVISAGWLDLINLVGCDIISLLHKHQKMNQQSSESDGNNTHTKSKLKHNDCTECNVIRISQLPSNHIQELQQLALLIDLKKDTLRIWLRNLGRDDRVIAFWGKETRIPFLDEDVMNFISHFVPCYGKTNENFDDNDHGDDFLYSASQLSPFYALCDQFDLIKVEEKEDNKSSLSQNIVSNYIFHWNQLITLYNSTYMNKTLLYPNNMKSLKHYDFNVQALPINHIILPIQSLANMNWVQGAGDKLLLRTIIGSMSITKKVASLQKRAMQFGSKIANRNINGIVKLKDVENILDVVNQQLL